MKKQRKENMILPLLRHENNKWIQGRLTANALTATNDKALRGDEGCRI